MRNYNYFHGCLYLPITNLIASDSTTQHNLYTILISG
jgi:hypothetical protein